jgi:hypothetical protein
VVEVELGSDVAVRQGVGGLGGEEGEEPRDLIELARPADVAQIPVERGVQVVGEPPVSPTAVAQARLGITTRGDDAGEGIAADGGSSDVRWLGRKERIDEVSPRFVDLALRQRPQPDGLHAPGERVLDLARGDDVRRAGEQESPRRAVSIDDVLDGEEQIGRPLGFVDERGDVQARDESRRVSQCRLSRRSVVEAELRGGMILPRDLARQRALAHLSCTTDEHDARVGECLQYQRSGVAGEYASHANERLANGDFRCGRWRSWDRQMADVRTANGERRPRLDR